MLTKLIPTFTFFTVLALNSISAVAAPNAVGQWLQGELAGQSIQCKAAKVNSLFEISATNGEIKVTVTEQDRGENYTVEKYSMENGQLKIALSNDVDGPLAQDLLLLPVNAIIAKANSLHGLDVYSEQYDGTTQRFQLDCQIKNAH